MYITYSYGFFFLSIIKRTVKTTYIHLEKFGNKHYQKFYRWDERKMMLESS